MVHVIPFGVNQFRDRYKGITYVLERGDHAVEGLGGILGTIVAKDNAAGTQVFVLGDGFDDGVHAVVLPIRAVRIPYK